MEIELEYQIEVQVIRMAKGKSGRVEIFSSPAGARKYIDPHEAIKFSKALASVGAVFTKLTMDNPDALDQVHDTYYNEERLEDLQRWPK